MSALEQALPLTDTERTLLSSKRTRALIIAPLMAGLSLFLFVLLLASIFVFQIFGLGLITELLFGLAFGISALVSTMKFVRLNRDLREGQKRLINAAVEDQDIDVSSGGGYSSSSYNFWVKAGGRKLSISEQQYYQLKKGDLVQAYLAPYSGTVLGISKTEELEAQRPARQLARSATG